MEKEQGFATFISDASKGRKIGAILTWVAAVLLLVALFVPAFKVKENQNDEKPVESSYKVSDIEDAEANAAWSEITTGENGVSVTNYLLKLYSPASKVISGNTSSMGIVILAVICVLLLAGVVCALFTMNMISMIATLGVIVIEVVIYHFGFKAIITGFCGSAMKSTLTIPMIILLAVAAVVQIAGVVLHFAIRDPEAEEDDTGWDSVPPADDRRNSETDLVTNYQTTKYPENETMPLHVDGGSMSEKLAVASLVQLNTGKSFTIYNNSEVILGKGSQANIVIANPIISRIHAKIICRGSSCTIQDLGSKNGTYVGDQKLSGNMEVQLFNDAYITLGNEVLQIKMM